MSATTEETREGKGKPTPGNHGAVSVASGDPTGAKNRIFPSLIFSSVQ